MVSLEILEQCQGILEHRFHDARLLNEALTHASCATDRLLSNERLEFLGDAVLGLVICRYVYESFPDWAEGQLTILKSAVVSRKTCAKVSNAIGLTDLIRVGPGMERPGRLPASLAAGVLESVVGAIYLDAGFEEARRFVLRHMRKWIDFYASSAHHQNFKSLLQQHAQRTFGCVPAYDVLGESGPDHKKSFQVRVRIADREFEPAWESTKKQAEQRAALLALQALNAIDETSLEPDESALRRVKNVTVHG